MAYTKTTWANGDVITADKLNNLEGGVYNASPYIVTATGDETITLDKTWRQIKDAIDAGCVVLVKNTFSDGAVFNGMVAGVSPGPDVLGYRVYCMEYYDGGVGITDYKSMTEDGVLTHIPVG